MFFLPSGQEFLAGGIIPQEEDGRFGKRPCEMGLANFGPCRTRAFAVGFLGTLDQTARGGKLLHPREAVDGLDFVEQYEAEHLADAWYRL